MGKKVISIDQELPAIGTMVNLLGKDFSCDGYRDARGVWRRGSDRAELSGVVGWIELYDDSNVQSASAIRTPAVGPTDDSPPPP